MAAKSTTTTTEYTDLAKRAFAPATRFNETMVAGVERIARFQYELAGEQIDAYVLMERQQGRWYLSDLLRRARAEAAATPAVVAR